MKTKQIIYVVIILLIGILIGKFVLSGSNSVKEQNAHQGETAIEHWTCSMHPQIDMPEPGKCPICGMDLIPKTKNDESLSANSFKMTKNAIALANIQTQVIGGKLQAATGKENTLKLSGTIRENDKKTAVQTAHFGGRIEKLYYKSEGEYVNKGSLIASLYSPELVTAQNEFIQALDIKNEQPELYKAVRNKLKNWKISEKQIQQIENNKKVITNFNMYANVSGYITKVMVEEGDHVKEGNALFKVSDLSSVWADLDVYEKDIPNIKRGTLVKIKLNAFPEKIIKAKIDFIDPLLNPKTRTTTARATLKNTKKELKPGMILVAEAKILQARNNAVKATFIPKTAVLWTGKRSVVYVKTQKNAPVFELREVQLGQETTDAYQVVSGLNSGDEIVINGTFTVDATAQLLGKRSMMNNEIEKLKLKNKEEREKIKNIERINVNEKFKKQLGYVFNDYLTLKDAFVASDVKKASSVAKKMSQNLSKIQMSLLKKPKAHEIWMPANKKIKLILETMQNETDIEAQRKLFISLSNEMIVLAKTFGTDKTIYVAHCPMANSNQGADWLSLEKEIKNPYFGDKMLTCGNVKETIKE